MQLCYLKDNENSSNKLESASNTDHSRKNKRKQLEITFVVFLRGIERILRQFFENLLNACELSLNANDEKRIFEENWLNNIWDKIIHILSIGSIGFGNDTISASVDLMVLCCQLASKAGVKEVTGHVRVGTNMQVVDGALRKVRESNMSDAEKLSPQILRHTLLRKSLFLKSFKKLVDFSETIRSNALPKHESENKKFSFIYVLDETLLLSCTKLSNGLHGLYQCCREHELSPYNDMENDGERTFEEQFLEIIIITFRVISKNHPSRFLSQGQRNALQILGIMSKHSSISAIKKLSYMSETAFL